METDDALLADEVNQAVSGCCGDSSCLKGEAIAAVVAAGDGCTVDALRFHVAVDDGGVVAVAVVEMVKDFQS